MYTKNFLLSAVKINFQSYATFVSHLNVIKFLFFYHNAIMGISLQYSGKTARAHLNKSLDDSFLQQKSDRNVISFYFSILNTRARNSHWNFKKKYIEKKNRLT